MINQLIAKALPYIPPKLVWIFSKKYIAGTDIQSAVKTSVDLNARGYSVTIDLLGEFIETLSQAKENRDQYLNIIESFENCKIDNGYSVKPTMFGLLIDKEKCYNYIREVTAKVVSKKKFIRIDMEDSECTDMEIELYEKLRNEFPNQVGLVIQAYLKRSISDIQKMIENHNKENPLNLRICKGIYVESHKIAYKDYNKINQNFIKILEMLFKNKIFTAIATHDKNIVRETYRLIDKYQVSKKDYEFQMLYGVTPDLRESVLNNGHKLRVYVPFGKDWFGYSTRRLKENPDMVKHVIKALFSSK